MTICTDPRCTTTGTCWRAANERYGDAPGENYGPRCVPVPAHALARAYDMGRDKERADVLEFLRNDMVGYCACCGQSASDLDYHIDIIERGEHREVKP